VLGWALHYCRISPTPLLIIDSDLFANVLAISNQQVPLWLQFLEWEIRNHNARGVNRTLAKCVLHVSHFLTLFLPVTFETNSLGHSAPLAGTSTFNLTSLPAFVPLLIITNTARAGPSNCTRRSRCCGSRVPRGSLKSMETRRRRACCISADYGTQTNQSPHAFDNQSRSCFFRFSLSFSPPFPAIVLVSLDWRVYVFSLLPNRNPNTENPLKTSRAQHQPRVAAAVALVLPHGDDVH
jgi:hypothetical protein